MRNLTPDMLALIWGTVLGVRPERVEAYHIAVTESRLIVRSSSAPITIDLFADRYTQAMLLLVDACRLLRCPSCSHYSSLLFDRILYRINPDPDSLNALDEFIVLQP